MSRRTPTRPGQRDDDALGAFVRGATVGAFIGAVIAGSTIWRRIRRRVAASRMGGPAGPPGSAARPADTSAGLQRSVLGGVEASGQPGMNGTHVEQA